MTKDKTATITLDYPIQLADRLLTEVTMRRPTVRDILAHTIKDSSDVSGESRLIAALCGFMPEDIMEMDLADYGKLQQRLISFRNDTNA